MHPDIKLLRKFHFLQELSEEQLELLAQSLEIKSAPKGKRVIQQGETQAYSFLLLAGEVELLASDGGKQFIAATSDSARNPIAQLVPRKYHVTAASPILFLEVDTALLKELLESSQFDNHSAMRVEHDSTFFFSHEPFGVSDQDLLSERLRNDIEQDKLILPSLPEVAIRIGRALNDNITDASKIARMIQVDPAMTAKIVKAANSALYAGRQPVDSCTGAIVRLGINITHKLVLSFALREVFHAKQPTLRKHMQTLWSHSTRVAAICYVLARLTRRFNPEHAMLAGLIHDIGNLAILSYADRFQELEHNEQHLLSAITLLRDEIGAMILKKWQFSEDFVLVAREAEHWMRDPTAEADYCDLVIIAQLHSYVGTQQLAELPRLDQIPGFAKLKLGELTPRMSLKILEKAEGELAQAEALLRN
jgi:HD-like signal output (HDOD) protein